MSDEKAPVDLAEVLRMAVQDEQTGIAFYRALVQHSRDPRIRARFRGLAEQESEHLEMFRGMLEEVGSPRPLEEYSGEVQNYIRALRDSRPFPDEEAAVEWAHRASSDLDAIRMGMRLERETLLFLQEMRDAVEPPHSEYVDRIIKEERTHVVELADMLIKLQY